VAGSARWAPSSSPKSSSASSAVTSPPTSTTRPRSSRRYQSPQAADSPWGSSQPSLRAPRPRCPRSRGLNPCDATACSATFSAD
jgi:hypothetical protein